MDLLIIEDNAAFKLGNINDDNRIAVEDIGDDGLGRLAPAGAPYLVLAAVDVVVVDSVEDKLLNRVVDGNDSCVTITSSLLSELSDNENSDINVSKLPRGE